MWNVKRPILLICGALILLQVLIPVVIYIISPTENIVKKTEIENEKPSKAEISVSKEIKLSNQVVMYDVATKKNKKMKLEDYVVGVVMAEMPASFGIEALKAQAVAARTYAVYRMVKYPGGHPDHKGASVCSTGQHCQAWEDESIIDTKWGKDKATYYEKIKQAVKETEGEVLVYKGEPIDVLYYAASNGYTEEASEVFSMALPYYKSVESPGEEGYSYYYGKKELSANNFIKTVEKSFGDTGLTTKKLVGEVKILDYTEGNRVKTIQLGKLTLQGSEFRRLFELNSTSFNIELSNNKVIISTEGYGHGVGMSQVGANVMAQDQKTYQEILSHYYSGVTIQTIKYQ